LVVDVRGQTGAGIFDVLRRAASTGYNLYKKVKPIAKKGYNAYKKYEPVARKAYNVYKTDTVQQYVPNGVKRRERQAEKYVRSKSKNLRKIKDIYDDVQTIRQGFGPAAAPDMEELAMPREARKREKYPADNLRKKLVFNQIKQGRKLKKPSARQRKGSSDPLAELRAKLAQRRAHISTPDDDDDDDWDGAGMYPVGAGMYPVGGSTSPVGGGRSPGGAGRKKGKKSTTGRGMYPVGGNLAKQILPGVVREIMMGTGMCNKSAAKLLKASLARAKVQKGSGDMNKTIAQMSMIPFQILNPVKKAIIKRVQSELYKTLGKQRGGNFWDTLKGIAGTVAPFLPLLL
jgi:hypothetical protein